MGVSPRIVQEVAAGTPKTSGPAEALMSVGSLAAENEALQMLTIECRGKRASDVARPFHFPGRWNTMKEEVKHARV